jgi:hypothetical protein
LQKSLHRDRERETGVSTENAWQKGILAEQGTVHSRKVAKKRNKLEGLCHAINANLGHLELILQAIGSHRWFYSWIKA